MVAKMSGIARMAIGSYYGTWWPESDSRLTGWSWFRVTNFDGLMAFIVRQRQVMKTTCPMLLLPQQPR
jgi:hypothetical protein